MPVQLHHHQLHVNTILWRIPHYQTFIHLEAKRFQSDDVSISFTPLLFLNPQEQLR